MNKLYNEEIKERFLATYENLGTQTTIRHVFYKSSLIESTLDIDLYNMNLDQIGKVVANAAPLNPPSARSVGRFITQYVNWSIENGLRESNINPLRAVPTTWYDQFVDKTKKIHFSKDEFFNEVIENLENPQDKAFLACVWYQIIGEKFTELSQMHYNHIHWNENKVDVYDENGTYNRTVTLPDRVMSYIEQAYKQDVYYTMKDDGEYKETELLRSDYIFRNVKSARAREGEPLNYNVFYTRLKAMRETFQLDHLTPNAIKQSALIHYAVQLYQRDGEFGLKQRTELGDKFNLPTVTNNLGKEYYNPAMLSFINPENIKMLYNIDVKM